MNEANVDLRNVGNVCRLCLSTKEPKSSVFSDQALGSVSLVTKIQTCLSIEILSSDKVSTSICCDCLKRVNKWHAYKEYCLRSQQKLEQCLGDRLDDVRNIKVEPTDIYESPSPLETVPLSSDDELPVEEEESRNESFPAAVAPLENDESVAGPTANVTHRAVTIKLENNENNHGEIEVESVASTELVLNPMAVIGRKEYRGAEAEPTEKSVEIISKRGMKKKVRRGAQTHYRGLRRYKQRCMYCQIYLHSKWSYAKHMERFHSDEDRSRKLTEGEVQRLIDFDDTLDSKEEALRFENESDEDEVAAVAAEIVDTEMVEDVEDELISLEKDAPLTPVQQNIISQLKTFSCYTCRLCFNDRRSTLNHIRQHMPDLRPYTCIACLTEFADRSIYKLHCGASFQCAMKIALVVPEHGTEKYFTCNMCLRSLGNRKELLSHLSRHSDRQYEQLIAAPFRSPPRLKPMQPLLTSNSSSRRELTNTESRSRGRMNMKNREIPAPYKNGDPAHNHACEFCGMIYRYKQNMFKHVSLCKKLPSDNRVCYRCVHCGMTFLAFSKFHAHVSQDHRKRELVCYRCDIQVKPSDFISHYREHYTQGMNNSALSSEGPEFNDERSQKVERWNSEVYREWNQACDKVGAKSSYRNKNRLLEQRKNHHAKVSGAYSCTICHCTFGKASILAAHMADHDTEDVNSTGAAFRGYEDGVDGYGAGTNKLRFSIKSDPGGSNTECQTCGKVFANYPNLRRHIRTVHDVVGRFSCFTCAKTFVHEEQWTEHVDKEHRRAADQVENCPQCPETFESQQELIFHRHNVHGLSGEDHLACYICGKVFASETSLKIHRGHHFRVNSRLSIGNTSEVERHFETERDRKPVLSKLLLQRQQQRSPTKAPRARKSFPNGSPSRQAQNSATLQCQVCDDHFNDVDDLRKHLWDIHCARNKPEKSFISEKLQCQLCTNVLPDEESLESHIKWHESNPILSNRVPNKQEEPVQCDLCGKYYSSIANLRKHKKRHKAATLVVNGVRTNVVNKKSTFGNGFTCTICRKVFGERSTMMKHRAVAHPGAKSREETSETKLSRTVVKPEVVKPVRPKLDFDTLTNPQNSTLPGNAKKTMACNLCRKVVPDVRALYKHRRLVHKITNDAIGSNLDYPRPTNVSQVSCTACPKLFSNATNMKQHFTKVHGPNAIAASNRSSTFRCSVNPCKFTFKTLAAKLSHEKIHANVIYTCALCPRHLLSPTAIAEHMLAAHKTAYTANYEKTTLYKKIDLDNYVVKGANGRQCPMCKITYPNNKALKVHYLKVHER